MLIPAGAYVDSPLQTLLRSLTSFHGVTTANGNAGGTTLVCAGLAAEPSYAGHQVAVLTGGAWGQAMRAATHVGNTIGLAYAYTNSAGAPQQILAGTSFVVLKESWGLDIAAVLAVLNAFPVLQNAGGTLAATGGEDTVILVNAPAGIFVPHRVPIDLTNMAVGDNIIIRLYERITLAGALVLEDQVPYNGVQVPALISIDLGENRFGFHVTLEQTAGVNRNYDWAYFFEA